MEILNTQIRRYTAEDYPKLLELTNACYDKRVHQKFIQRFQWQFMDNPNNDAQGPLIFVLEEGNRFVGMIASTSFRIKMGDHIYPAHWVGDFMVHPDCRKSFNGLKLVRIIRGQQEFMIGFPLEKTINLWFRAKAIEFGQLLEYKRKLTCIDHALNLWPRPPRDIDIKEITTFDERFERLWENLKHDYPIIQVRDRKFLNWRFFQCPQLSYRVMAAIRKNEVVGYVVTRGDNIIDIFADKHEPETLKVLIKAGMVSIRESGCDSVTMVVSMGDRILNNILLQNSFVVSAEKERGILFNNVHPEFTPMIKTQNNWHVTKADSDMDFS